MMVCACAAEEQTAFIILEDVAGDKIADLHLAHGSGKIERSVQLEVLGNIAEQIIHAFKTDGLEHFLALSRSIRDVTSH